MTYTSAPGYRMVGGRTVASSISSKSLYDSAVARAEAAKEVAKKAQEEAESLAEAAEAESAAAKQREEEAKAWASNREEELRKLQEAATSAREKANASAKIAAADATAALEAERALALAQRPYTTPGSSGYATLAVPAPYYGAPYSYAPPPAPWNVYGR
jgi:septal ring factor EnvC (AmiA/AmiB activator)